MQVFRLMDMPDRVIAFDELPENLLVGFEMCRADGFPRHWKQWLGTKKKITPIPPEKDFLTGQIRRYDPIVEEDAFFYLVDYTVNPCVEKWKAVCDYVRQHVSKEVRLMERIDDMALPLAANKTDGVSLEPEEVPIIPLPKIQKEVTKEQKPVEKETNVLKCLEAGCEAEYSGRWARNAINMHKRKSHKKEPVVA